MADIFRMLRFSYVRLDVDTHGAPLTKRTVTPPNIVQQTTGDAHVHKIKEKNKDITNFWL